MKFTQISMLLLATATISPVLKCSVTNEKTPTTLQGYKLINDFMRGRILNRLMLKIGGRTFDECGDPHDTQKCFEFPRTKLQRLESTPELLEQALRVGSLTLHTAAAWGDAELVAFLLKKGCSPRETDEHGATALHYVSRGMYCHIHMVLELLHNNPSLVAGLDEKEISELIKATFQENNIVLPDLMERHFFLTFLTFAKSTSSPEAFIPILKENYAWCANVHRKEAEECAKLLIRAGAEVNAQEAQFQNTPLHYAVCTTVAKNLAGTLSMLGAKYDNKNLKGRTPRDFAANYQTNMLHSLERVSAQYKGTKIAASVEDQEALIVAA